MAIDCHRLSSIISLADASHGLISKKDDQSMNKNFVVFDGHRLSSIVIDYHRLPSIIIDSHRLSLTNNFIDLHIVGRVCKIRIVSLLAKEVTNVILKLSREPLVGRQEEPDT